MRIGSAAGMKLFTLQRLKRHTAFRGSDAGSAAIESIGSILDTKPFAGIDDGRALAEAIVDTLREPLLVLDKDLRVVAASRSFYLTFKVSRQDVQGRPIYALGDGQWNIPSLRLLLEEILPQHTVMEAYQVEHDFVQIGRRTMLLNARAVFHESNTQTLILLAIEDVTDRRAAERAAAELLKQTEILLLEMQHRVANSLQIIASILLLKARNVQSEETRQHLQEAHQRVMSVASVQQQLRASGHGDRIEIAPYLSRLCETLAASMIGENRAVVLRVQAEGGAATSTEAVSIGLIVTELVINALKHAFAEDRAGDVIVVSYNVAEKGWRLAVSDNGSGKPGEGPVKTVPGLGTSIVEALAKQLDAQVAIAMTPQGRAVSITHGTFLLLPSAA
jgi:chemotaxis protein methyltransferase CheR